MIPVAVTISLVPQAKGGPFVFWEDLPRPLESAQACGFHAVEIFAPGPETLDPVALPKLMQTSGLKLAAVGTGGGWVIHKWQLCDADPQQRTRAKDFIRAMIDRGGPCGAPAIIGSMQGRWSEAVDRDQALQWLGEALVELGAHAAQYGVPLLYEPLNRYETNLINRLEDGVEFLMQSGAANVKLLADLYHMNIEEQNLAAALTAAGSYVGHMHFVDSNRRPAGNGHIDYVPIARALREMNYGGYLSAEAFSWPDALAAAQQTMVTYRHFFG